MRWDTTYVVERTRDCGAGAEGGMALPLFAAGAVSYGIARL